MEYSTPSLIQLDHWLLTLASGCSALIAGTVYLIFG